MSTTTASPARPRAKSQSHGVVDPVTLLRRNLLHMVRYPGLSLFTILGPLAALLFIVDVFGGTLGAGLPGVDPNAGREA